MPERSGSHGPSASSTVQGGKEPSPVERGKDMVLVHGVTEDRKGWKVLRARDQRVELGEVRPVVEGQPLTSDVVRLHPRPEAPLVCDVETQFSLPQAKKESHARSGPAQVATQAYRDNWDTIWSRSVTAPGSSELN